MGWKHSKYGISPSTPSEAPHVLSILTLLTSVDQFWWPPMTCKLTFPTPDSKRICSHEVGGLSGESEKHPGLMCSRLSSQWGCSISQTLRPSSLAYQWTYFNFHYINMNNSYHKKHPEFDLLQLTAQPQGSPSLKHVQQSITSPVCPCLGVFSLFCSQKPESAVCWMMPSLLSGQIGLPAHSPSSDDSFSCMACCTCQACAIAVPSATQQPLCFLYSIWVEYTPTIQPTF